MRRSIVLLNPPGRRLYQRDWYDGCVAKGDYLWPPVNLLVQTGWLGRVGDLHVVDAMAERLPPGRCLDRVAALAPDVVVLLTGSASWDEDLPFGERVRARTGARLVGHGDAFAFEPRAALERWPWIDAALYDFTSPGLADWVAGGPEGGAYADVMHRVRAPAELGGDLVEGPWRRGRNDLDYPVPLHDRFPLDRYRMPFGPVEPLTALLTNYGCPHGCSFCNKPALGFRLRPLAAIADELAQVARTPVERLFVADMTFNVSRARVLEVCEVLARAPRRFRFSAYARPDYLDREQLRAMKRAGLLALHFGVESGDDDVLASNGKAMTRERVVEAFALCREEGVLAGAHFLLGLPGETASGLDRTVALARHLTPDFAAVNIAMPRMGTRLRTALDGRITNPFFALNSSSGAQPIETSSMVLGDLSRGRRRLMRTLYFRPRFLARQLAQLRTAAEALNLVRNGVAVLRSYGS